LNTLLLYAIVFVHLGSHLPHYQHESLSQARLFNPKSDIYLLANESALQELQNDSIIPIPCESLTKSEAHQKYLKETQTTGFWRVVVERFFYLEEFLRQYQLSSVFHLENDVMLYRDLSSLVPPFQKHYPNQIGATFDNDQRCIPGFMYIDTVEPLTRYVEFVASRAAYGENDMALFGHFRSFSYKKWIDHLPIVLPTYADSYPLQTFEGKTVKTPSDYFNHFDSFHSLFDAAAFGQYIGGLDPIHHHNEPGFINESCIFNPARFQIHWAQDEQERWIPFATFRGETIRLNNLHIHSKNLNNFSSKTSPSSPIPATLLLDKKHFDLSGTPIDVILIANEKNLPSLNQSIESLHQYGTSIRRIIVISSQPFTEKAEWFDEKNFPFSKELILDQLFTQLIDKKRYPYHPKNQLNKIFAQLLSLYAPLTIPSLSENVLVIEPDVLLLTPVQWMTEKGEPLFHVQDKYIQAHKALAVRLFPSFFFENYTDIKHFILIQKPILEDFFLEIQRQHKEEPWKAICRALDYAKFFEPCISCFGLYGSYAIARTEQALLRPLKETFSLPAYPHERWKEQGYDFIYTDRS
jgi:hypothetical protein